MNNVRLSCQSLRGVCLLILVLALLSPGDMRAEESSAEARISKLLFCVSGGTGTGKVTTAMTPKGIPAGDHDVDVSSFWGFYADYRLEKNVRLFADLYKNHYRKLVAEEGGYGSGIWVFEQTDYNSHEVGPFKTEVHFHMTTNSLRVGPKLDFPLKNGLLWVGAGVGVYNWRVSYGTLDKAKTYGTASGSVTGLTYLAGIDAYLVRTRKDMVVISVFVDLASPVAYPKIEDLFLDGWTWDNVGGSHVVTPYRFGLSLGFAK